MSKFLTILLLVFIIITAILSIMDNEKKRKQDKTVLVDTARAAALVDSLYVTGGGVLISNDSTITISCEHNKKIEDFEQRYARKMQMLKKLDSILLLQMDEIERRHKHLLELKRAIGE